MVSFSSLPLFLCFGIEEREREALVFGDRSRDVEALLSEVHDLKYLSFRS